MRGNTESGRLAAAVVKETYELRRHPVAVRSTALAVFYWLRSRELTDTVDALPQLVLDPTRVRSPSVMCT